MGNGMDGTTKGAPSRGLCERFLGLFTVVLPGEAPKALLLALNIFLLLLAYYLIKPVRDALLLAGNEAAIKSYLGAAQAVLFIFVVKAFSALASKRPRHILIAWVTLFFASNLVVFYALHLAGLGLRPMGIAFFTWIGIFNYLVVAQFWGFANDLYTEEAGKRLFPLIAFGATFGAVSGSRIAEWLIVPLGVYRMMLVSAAVLVVTVLLSVRVHHLEVRACAKESADCTDERRLALKAQEKPLEKGGGFKLVFKSRYLLFIALLIAVYNFINATGEYIISDISRRAALHAIQAGTAGGLSLEQIIGRFFADYQLLTNLLALVIQLFLVSRVFKWIGVGGALFILPFIALGGYGYVAFGASLLLVKWVKSLENGTDYSLMNTTKAALFLITPREEKYKAKAAIDTFFVRGGDALAALAVFVGTTWFALPIERYAVINVVMVVIWLGLCVLIVREYRAKKRIGRSREGT
jgi:AAA family ATP:ADP antiporter